MATLPRFSFSASRAASAKREDAVVLLARPDGGVPETAEGDDVKRLQRAIRVAGYRARKGETLDVLPPSSSEARTILFGLGDKPLSSLELMRCGGGLAAALRRMRISRATIRVGGIEGIDEAVDASPWRSASALLAFGAALRLYVFDAYKSRRGRRGDDESRDVAPDGSDESRADDSLPFALERLSFEVSSSREALSARRDWTRAEALIAGIFSARDLVNEPPNVLSPSAFADRLVEFGRRDGFQVEILDEKRLRSLGMRAMLGVSQGSRNPPRLAIMRRRAGAPGAPTLALIGKGVTFDSGGLSLKPPSGMVGMKGDMAGAACVAGTMRALSRREARVNAVGLVGLVENMPDGKAQRPGDVVRSRDGRTIEILNTDAEGRLVLADVLSYAQSRFSPSTMIDVATLTGAVIIALGKEFAGLFSSDDELASRLVDLGESVGERLWRLPLDAAFDRALRSRCADVKNVGGGEAGSCTAAQFLKRFVSDRVAWAHLDIAGTGMSASPSALNESWGPGFGVRLLDGFVARYFESPPAKKAAKRTPKRTPSKGGSKRVRR